MNKKLVKLKFRGVDNWNRPVFKDIDNKRYYGSVNFLFSENEKEKNILSIIQEEDLEYFGTSFGCEPHGGINPNIELKIIT